MNSDISRLAYLAVEFRPDLPPRRLLKFVPMADIVSALCTKGIAGASAELDIAEDQLFHLYQEGKRKGTGSLTEFKLLLSQAVSAQIDMRRDDLTLTDYFKMVGMLSAYTDSDSAGLIDTEEVSLDSVPDYTPMEKFESGFEPIDLITGGLYQGIMMIMAKPGAGKTSIMLSLMESLRMTGSASSIWYYELEIPLPLMLYRNMPCRKRVKFQPDDRIICGLGSIEEVIDRVKADPDPRRVVIIDSPDVMAGGSDEGRRFVLEEMYRDLIRLKKLCGLVVVASQPRRQDRYLGLESMAEAWAKAFYCDIIVTLVRQQRSGVGQWTRVRAEVVKNRFGPPDRNVTFSYNYADLAWELDTAARERAIAGGEDEEGDW